MNIFDFMKDINDYESRKVGRWEEGEKMVSTVIVSDGAKPFETAISHPGYNNGKWIIVASYDDLEAAKVGHEKWVKMVIEDCLPNKLVDVHNSWISQMMDDEEFERN